MRSSTPIFVGFFALVGMAFWYDAHSTAIADAAIGYFHREGAGSAEATGDARGAAGVAGATPGATGSDDRDATLVVAARANASDPSPDNKRAP